MLRCRPDALLTDLFILHDHGQNLFLVDALSTGRWLYRDVASAYGPLPPLGHWAAAAIFGNSARTYLHLWQALTVLGAGMLFCLLRRVASRGLALGWSALVVFPLFLMPTAARAVLAYTLYPAWERLTALGLALCWRPLAERSQRRTFGLGALLGGMQLLKFGIAFPAGVALLATDLLTTSRRAPLRRSDVGGKQSLFLRHSFGLLAGFAVVEAAFAGGLLLILPPARTLQVLWPVNMLASYRAYVTPDLTYLGACFPWRDFHYFLAQQLPLLAAALLTFSFLARWAYRWGRERNVFGLARVPFRKVMHTLPATGDAGTFGWALMLAIYFPVAVLTVGFPQWVGAQSEWMLAAVALAGFVLLWNTASARNAQAWWRVVLTPRFAAGLGVIAFLPGALAWVSQLQRPGEGRTDAASPRPATLPNGETLWLSAAERAAFAEVNALLAGPRIQARSTPPKVLFLPMAGGWQHYFGYGLPEGTRQRWIMAGMVPRDEEPDVVTALADADAVVFTSRYLLTHPVGRDPAGWRGGHNPGFGLETNAAFRRHLGEPIPIDDRLTVFPTRR